MTTAAAQEKRIPVKVNSTGRIPFIGGYGPFKNPVFIKESEYNALVGMGYKVEQVKNALATPKKKEEAPVAAEEQVQEQEEKVVETPVEEEAEVTEEEAPVEEEEVVEEEEEILIDDENLSAGAFYTMEFLSKDKAIKILEARGVEFNSNDNATPLKELVISTNPEVEFEEE
jgi:hypothetical protein